MKSRNSSRYSDREKANASLSAVFPDLESFHCFKSDNHEAAVQSLISFAKRNEILPSADEKAFQEFIGQNDRTDQKSAIPSSMSFKDLKDRLGFQSFRWLANRIGQLIEKYELEIPMVSQSMLSRLNNEPLNTTQKRNALRLIAFWIGQDRTELAGTWHYKALESLCSRDQPPVKINEGARIAFSLHGRGEVINENTIKWFRRELKNCIEEQGITSAALEGGASFQLTEFSIRITKSGELQEGYSHPKSYRHCVRDAIAIANQISIKWLLSSLNSPRKFLAIGIAAGEFSEMDIQLKALVNAKLPGDPIIRVTDFTHLCILINNIRAIFCNEPSKIETIDGGILTLWWFVGLWSIIYWDFAPDILAQEMLPRPGDSSLGALKKALWFPDEIGDLRDQGKGIDAIIHFFRFPQNTLLGIEIAKTLYYRRMYFEADEILKIILSTEPYSLVARTLRIIIFGHLGANDNVDFSISKIHFKWAEDEVAFCLKHCAVDEDFYCEYGLIKMIHALRILRILRKTGKPEDTSLDEGLTKRNVFYLLRQSVGIFNEGVTVSPTGYRSLYWIVLINSLIRMLERDEELLFTDKPFTDEGNCCIETVVNMFKALGWLKIKDQDITLDDLLFLDKRLQNATLVYTDSILNRSQKVSAPFYYVVLNWDLNPFVNVSTAIQVIRWLRESIEMAKHLQKDGLGVFSALRLHGDILPVDHFIRLIERLIHEFEKRVGSLEELEKRNPAELIDPNTTGHFKIFSYFIGETIEIGI